MNEFLDTNSPWHRLLYYGLEFFGRYYSTYRGFVIENKDPDNQNRVKVVVPGINPNTAIGTWAYPKDSWGGKDYGVSLLPQIGDMVFVEFQYGDTEVPLWTHAGWGHHEKPEELIPTTNYGFKTPKGTLVVIEDADDGQVLVKYRGKEYWLVKKELIELESKGINLGKDANEQAVLGNKLEDKMNSILDKMDSLCELLSTHSHPSQGSPPTQATQFILLQQQFKGIATSLKEILSGVVKLK